MTTLSVWVITHRLCVGGVVMAKSFADYAQERRAAMGPEGREAERIFRAAYAFCLPRTRRPTSYSRPSTGAGCTRSW